MKERKGKGSGLPPLRPKDSGHPLFTAEPAPHVDKGLVRGILELENSYKRSDLRDESKRKQHLRLCAEAFAAYAGENMTVDDLVSSVVFGERSSIDAKTTNAGGYTDITGQVVIPLDAVSYTQQFVSQMRRLMPWWSPLSRARMTYEHEWFHRAGLANSRTDQNELLAPNYQGLIVDYSAGFLVSLHDAQGNHYDDKVLEEGYVYEMTGYFEKILTGYETQYERFERIHGAEAAAMNASQNRLHALFRRMPEWRQKFQQFHRNSDTVGLALFLARNSGKRFTSEDAKLVYGFNALTPFKSL